MVWAFLDRWAGLLVLTGISKGDPGETLVAVDDAFGEARVSITDVHFFSGVHVSFKFVVAPGDVPALAAGLANAGVELDEASHAGLAEAAQLDREVEGTLALTLAHGDPDQRHEIPKVPG